LFYLSHGYVLVLLSGESWCRGILEIHSIQTGLLSCFKKEKERSLLRTMVNLFRLLAFQSIATTSRRSLLFHLSQLFVTPTKSMAATKPADASCSSMVRVLVAGGDTMLGRAVQLTFPHQSPGEEWIRDSCTAQHYLDMSLNHPSGGSATGNSPDLEEIRQRNAKGGSYLWGDYLGLTITPPPDVKLINLETAVTRSINKDDVPLWKGIRYHMHVDNFEKIILAGFQAEKHGGGQIAPVVMSCANNHIMDYGRQAMEEETFPLLDRLRSEMFQTVGCGQTIEEASKPATVALAEPSVNLQVFGFASGCSGTPSEWWATASRSGLMGLPSLGSNRDVNTAMKIAKKVFHGKEKSETDLRIVSIHWGPNWAMKHETESEMASRRDFAHRLIDECHVDMIYGHSSHHSRGMELYKGKLILYGTGDLINDYEGFENPGEEIYNRLGGLYVVDIDPRSGDFRQLRLVPTFVNRLQLKRHTPESFIWQPNQRQLLKSTNKSKDLCLFLNKLSVTDAGGKERALELEYCQDDPQIPGGPILRSRLFQSECVQ
jgi:poly-gamma-glutamate capsule biosynthesis protein CapA/YwtB (metallophosphatase superfamily)